MNIIDQIIDFFVRLVRGRIDSVEIQAKSKMMAIQTKAKQQASKQFNSTVDHAVGKGKSADQSKKPPIGPSGPAT